MKLLSFLLVLVSTTSFSQTWPSNCNSTIVSERIFRNDVYKLALHRLIETNNPNKDSIEIPQIHIDSIARILYCIYNMQPSLKKDSLLYYFGYDTFDTSGSKQLLDYQIDSCHILHNRIKNYPGGYSIKRVTLGIKRNALNNWADDWAVGNYNNTSNSDVNELVDKYDLSVKINFTSANYYYMTIKTRRAINTSGLAKRFYDIMGGTSTNEATAYNYIGDGNSIHLDYLLDGVVVTFRNGCGDCPAGCDYGRLWMLKINAYTDCSVTYIKDSIYWIYVPQPNGIYVCNRDGGDIVTPVHFRNVIGEVTDTKANITWDVLTESNIRYYAIEKSIDSRAFYEVGRVYATSQSTPSKTYTWQDKLPLYGSGFFRIKAVEHSGEVIYSKTILLKTKNTKWIVSVFPNPISNHEMKLQFGGQFGEVQVMLYSMEGKQLFAKTCNSESTSTTLLLPNTIKSGTYLLNIKSLPDQNEIKQLMVIR